jgi:hypothetical protein
LRTTAIAVEIGFRFSSSSPAVRGYKYPTARALLFTARERDAFLTGVRDGEFDR